MSNMKRAPLIGMSIFFSVAVLGSIAWQLHGYTFALLEPRGTVALAERGLIIHALLLMLIVVIPVFILIFAIAWRYRASNSKAVYTPNWEHSTMEELVWWAVPIEIILVLGALTWSSSRELDPYRPLTSEKPFVVEVVALDWKWLFIYPTLGTATLGEVDFPAGHPVEFDLTADAPMNSFWIPQLGGQIYVMTGMVTQLHLQADTPGTFRGSSANYSGDGFAHMTFAAKALSESDFITWSAAAKTAPLTLTMDTYKILASPSTNTPPITYGSVDPGLFASIINQFMPPSTQSGHDMMPMHQ